MAPIAIIAILLAVLAALCLIAALSQLWAMGGQAEEPVGPLHARRPEEPRPPLVPANFRSLIGGEAVSWHQPHVWSHLATRLDEIERRLGGDADPRPAPEEFSAQWLEERVTHIETVSGPLPSPMQPSQQSKTKERFWKRR